MKRFPRTHEEFEHELIILKLEGWSIRALTRRFKVGRNTVRRILRAHESQRNNGHDLLQKKHKGISKIDDFIVQIKKLIAKFPEITGLRIFEELKLAGYTGKITILRDYLQKHRAPLIEPVIRFETDPGEQSQMDWSPYTIPFIRTGKSLVQCFSYIMGFSRRHYIDFTLRHDFFTLVRQHQKAFDYNQGVTRQCLYDNEKTVVLRWEAGRPVFNPAFTAFITHYNCKPIACRPRTPKTKGKIEEPFQYVEGNLLCGREFQDMEDLRAVARWWLREKSDKHTHNTTKRPPIELFMEEEQAALRPLPLFPYDTSEVALAICNSESFIRFETNQYSVPSGHIADILSVKATEKEILIYSPELDLLGRHERQPAGRGKKIEDPGHFRVKKDRYGLEPVREKFIALGVAAEEFLKGLTEKNPKNCGYHARFILGLKEQYHCDDIHRALEHALRYQAFDGKSIERILKAHATVHPLEFVRNERARQELEKVLPKITQRPLSEYGPLLTNQEEKDNDDTTGNSDKDQDPPQDPETDGNSEGS